MILKLIKAIHVLVIALFCILSSCKAPISMIETSSDLDAGVYICMGQKNCFGCIEKFSWLKDFVDSTLQYPVGLILETNQREDVFSDEIKRIEKSVGFDFDSYQIDRVKFDGPFNNSCGYLCKKSLAKFPAIIISDGKSLSVLPFGKLFTNSTDLNNQAVKDLINKSKGS
jgi:hypothetical protein